MNVIARLAVHSRARPPVTLGFAGRRLAESLVPAYAFLVPLVILPVNGERVGLTDALFPFAMAALCIARPIARLRFHHLAILMWLFAALLSVAQIHDGAVFNGSILRWLRLFAMTVPFFLSLVLPANIESVRRALRWFAWGGGAAVACGLLLYWMQIEIYEKQQRLWLTGGQPPTLRASGLMGETGAFGHLIALWGTLTIGMLAIESKPRCYMKMAVAFGIVFYAIVASTSRAALLNVTGGLLAFALLSGISHRTRRNAIVLSIVGVAVVAVAIVGWLSIGGNSGRAGIVLQGSIDRFTGAGQSSLNGFASGRLDNWSGFLSEFSDCLFLGMGYKASWLTLADRLPDNALLGIAIETGLPGLISILVALTAIFWGLFLRFRAGNRYAALLLAVWVGQMLHGFTADTFTMWTTLPLLYLATGLVLQIDPLDAADSAALPMETLPGELAR